MADKQITIDGSGNQVKHSPAGTTPLPPSAGLPVTATVKTVGNPNATVHGQVNAGGVIYGPIFDNPGQ